MQTKLLLTLSALFMLVAGIVLSFAPVELLHAVDVTETGTISLILQLGGALYLGFACTNWMSRGIIIGGIYARPLALGNFLHFAAAGLALVKQIRNPGTFDIAFYFITAIYIIFACWFGLVVFTHPIKKS